MSWRVQGKSVAFPKAAALTTGVYEIGQLIQLNTDSKAVATGGLITFPLLEKFDVAGGDLNASLQITGIAKVQVEVFTGIDVGSPVMIGAANGAILATDGEKLFGYALEKPTANLQFIPVLLTQGSLPAVV